MAKLAVFDVDGTLVDSRRSIAEAMRSAFAFCGLPEPTYDDTRKIVGLSLEPAIDVLSPGLVAPVRLKLAQAYKDAFVANRAAGLEEPLYDGALELLKQLRAEGWLLGVATGKARQGVEMVLSHHKLRDLFDCAFCADDGPGKPDPHMLHLNMRATGALAIDTIMIGDTSFDMQMARAAECYAQGVSWGFHTVDEIEAGGAHHVADDVAGLALALDSFRDR